MDRDVFALTAVAHRIQLGDVLQMLGRFDEAIEVGREAVSRAERDVAAGTPGAELYLSDALYKLGGHLAAAGAHPEAVRTLIASWRCCSRSRHGTPRTRSGRFASRSPTRRER